MSNNELTIDDCHLTVQEFIKEFITDDEVIDGLLMFQRTFKDLGFDLIFVPVGDLLPPEADNG